MRPQTGAEYKRKRAALAGTEWQPSPAAGVPRGQEGVAGSNLECTAMPSPTPSPSAQVGGGAAALHHCGGLFGARAE